MTSTKHWIVAFVGLGGVIATGALACSGESAAFPEDEPASTPEAATVADAGAALEGVPSGAYQLQLSGGSLNVTYTETPAGAELSYTDALGRTRTFGSAAITSNATPAGKMVTVVTSSTIDSSSTTFSLLIPALNLTDTTTAPIATEGITTVHHFVQPYRNDRGALEEYSFTPLSGSVAAATPSIAR